MLNNEGIRSLITALGTGFGAEEFKIENLRYGKVIIMTDADVDGSHIRILLLTFFFRHMGELIRRGNLYIAQPPLYLVRKGKKSRYLNTEEEMERFLFETVLDFAKITATNGQEKRASVNLKTLIRAVSAAHDRERMFSRLKRVYGVPREAVEKAIELPREKKLDPRGMSATEMRAIFGEGTEVIDTEEVQQQLVGDGNGNGNGHKHVVRHEHEVDLAFFRSHEFSALIGHADPIASMGKPPYHVENEAGEVLFETSDLLELREYLLTTARKGLQIQRYKGLGEMNPEQLQETTMDPEKRTLLQVTAENETIAGELFDTLMGDLVEPRKQFIEKHAPEIRNLDI
jgi:DNA gyrase subunit B